MLTPTLSGHWVGLVTPVPNSIARPLVESLKVEVVAAEHDIADYLPDPPEGLLGFEASVELALQRIRDAEVVTRWSSASVPGAPSDPLPTDPDWAGGSLYEDLRRRPVAASPETLWRVVEGIGGDRGWYSFPLAWRVRGLLDRFVGGVGLRRGRRDPDRVYVGETIDFWRVEERDPGELLRLRAEMRLPGLAWLELGVERDAERFGRAALDVRAAGAVPPARAARARLLVGGRAVPRHRVRRHGPQHRRHRRARTNATREPRTPRDRRRP